MGLDQDPKTRDDKVVMAITFAISLRILKIALRSVRQSQLLSDNARLHKISLPFPFHQFTNHSMKSWLLQLHQE